MAIIPNLDSPVRYAKGVGEKGQRRIRKNLSLLKLRGPGGFMTMAGAEIPDLMSWKDCEFYLEISRKYRRRR
jgi:hypothetical protein